MRRYLNEELSQAEKQWLENNEELTRSFIFRNTHSTDNDLGKFKTAMGRSVSSRGNQPSEDITDKEFEGMPKTIYTRVLRELNEFVNSEEAYNRILSQITPDNKNKPDIDDYIDGEKIFRLSDLTNYFDPDTIKFLRKLYDVEVGFGSNVIGKGELMFSLIFKGAELADHKSKYNIADITIKDKNLDIEVKGKDGRLSGTGVLIKNVTPEELKNLIAKEAKNTIWTTYHKTNPKVKELKDKLDNEILNFLEGDRANVFAAYGYNSFWQPLFTFFRETVPSELPEASQESTECLKNIMITMYKDTFYGKRNDSLDVDIEEAIEQLIDTDNYADFHIWDSTIRFFVYDKPEAEGTRGKYWILCKPSKGKGENILAIVINNHHKNIRDCYEAIKTLMTRSNGRVKFSGLSNTDARSSAPKINVLFNELLNMYNSKKQKKLDEGDDVELNEKWIRYAQLLDDLI
jgi:hypothetical protein